MKKLLVILGIVALVSPAFAELTTTYDDGISATISTATSVGCVLAYMVIETTGPVAIRTLTFRSSNTTLFTYVLAATTAKTEVLDFSRAPIKCSKGLNYASSVTDGGIAISVVYERVPTK